MPLHRGGSTTSTDISQPMVLTTHEDMYQSFVEALLVHPDDTVSFNSHGMRPPVETIIVNVPTYPNIAPPRRNWSAYPQGSHLPIQSGLSG